MSTHENAETRVIKRADQISGIWLEEVLTRSGALASGGIAGFAVHADQATWSNNARIQLEYVDGSTGELPASLFLKMVGAAEFGASEALYYTRDYIGAADAPVVRCYDAQHSATERAYHVLLDDLSATHGSVWEAPTTRTFIDALADAVAALHAFRWRTERLVELGAELHPEEALGRYFGHIRRGLEPLLSLGGDDVAPEWRPLLREIFDRHPPLMLERARDPRGICLVHGDINPGNILAPLNGDGRVYLVDRQPFDWSLTTWLGVSDLAYLMCSFWPVERRREYELPLLRQYHAGLLRRGVTDYPWEQLWADYRFTAVQAVYVAVEWCVLEPDRERMRWLWSRELRYAMAAVADLRCRELWQPAGG